jgi:hypothetical protein
MTEISKRSAIENAQEALEPGEQIERVFLAQAVSDRAAWIEEVKRQRAGEPARELPLSSRYDNFAVMASDRNLYVFPQTGQVRRGLGAAAKILATGNWTPLDTSAGQKHPLGSIRVTREGKRLHVGDLEFKIARINRKDADALVSFVEERSQPTG